MFSFELLEGLVFFVPFLLFYILNILVNNSAETNIPTMDVTKENFESILPIVKKSIEEATFIAIDCEFTGLNTVSNINAFDTIEQYYKKVKKNYLEFLVIQYGITAFRYDQTNNTFKQSSFNFYIFRRPVQRNIPDQRFLCQTSSIDFLISQGFDFNKLFKEGIPYLNIDEEAKYQQTIEETQKATRKSIGGNSDDKIAIPSSDQTFIDEIIESIKKYLESGNQEPLQLPKCNPFLRKLVYQTVPEVFGDKVHVETKTIETKERVLFISRVKSPEEFEELLRQKMSDKQKMLDETLGFSKVLRMIVDSGKLVIGHNMMLDMLHTIDKFLTPLPDDYKEFKDCAHSLFTNVLDTKFMSSSNEFKDLINSNVLGHLLESVKQEPFTIPNIEVEDGCKGYSLDENREHEAAFDAFITGISFLAMWNYLGNQKKLSNEATFSDFNLLKPYINKIFLMRLQDNQFVHLGGNDPNPSRKHVFHIKFPKDWKMSDIQQLFSPFGSIFISWINEESAFVGLYKRDQASLAFSSLSGHEDCVITPFSKYHEQNSVTSTNRNVRKQSPEQVLTSIKKRKICVGSCSQDTLLDASKKKCIPPNKMVKTFNESQSWD